MLDNSFKAEEKSKQADGAETHGKALSEQFAEIVTQKIAQQQTGGGKPQETVPPFPVPPPFPRPEPDPNWPDRCKPDGLPWPKPGCPAEDQNRGKKPSGGKGKHPSD